MTPGMNRLKPVLPLLVLIVIGAVLYFSGVLAWLEPERLLTEQGYLRAMIHDSPWLTRLGFIALVTISVATGVPGSIVLILAGGFLFGIVEGTIWSTVGLLTGSLILFLASRHAFRSGLRTAPALVEKIRNSYLNHPLNYTLFLRLVPIFPFGATTIALAWLRCPLWMFMVASATGGIIMLVFETAIGAGLASHLANGNGISFGMLLEPHIALPLLALAVLALVPVLFNWHLGRRRERQQHKEAEQD